MSEQSSSATSGSVSRHHLTLLVRAGCGACGPAREQLEALAEELGVEVTCIDVDVAAATDPDLRAEFGDRLPVVLLDGREHSYWEVDEPRLRADLAR
ncbi:MAG: glutaredoxin family protein [Rhodococcus sp. (in: high G+C Gram-positive bacteria)]|uniref:glutaredoxin family protein n=1 Tax=Rhodococcus TaxID=1827 RepID=UPI0011A5E606|nr:glutaredoxin family protein [Rhodococcus rhodochrous]MXQ76382.1 glutaredoxin family protein [Rhodococcus rhodochrous]